MKRRSPPRGLSSASLPNITNTDIATRSRSRVLGLAGRLAVQTPTLRAHNGCVNTISWNLQGSRLLSGADDCSLKIWDPYASELIASFESGHESNIFSAKFMAEPNNTKIISCAAEGSVRYMQLSESKPVHNGLFSCHSDLTYEVLPDPENPHIFFSCSDDGTVNQYDIRTADSCTCKDHCNSFTVIDVNRSKSRHAGKRHCEYVTNSKTQRVCGDGGGNSRANRLRRFFVQSTGIGVAAISIHVVHSQYLALGCCDDIVRVYDRRNLKPAGTIDWNLSDDESGTRGEVYSVMPEKFLRPVSVAGNASDADGEAAAPKRYRYDPHKITSMKFDPSGLTMDILVSYSDEKLYLVRPCGGAESFECTEYAAAFPEQQSERDIIRGYQGHRNRQTFIKEAYFFGPKSECVMSGSDDGSLVIWDKATGKMVNRVLKVDKSVVNCIAPNPQNSSMVAASGIDHDIKILLPTAEKPWLESKVAVDETISPESNGLDEDESDDEEGLSSIPRETLLMYLIHMGFSLEDIARVQGGDSGADTD